tara:strand:+ start:330 stop:548 length:219 start_codon:yes stop_codon:yes gene_type:complete
MKKTKKIKIILNGKSRSLQKATSVYDLMRSLKMPMDKIAIELNEEIINKKKIKSLYLKDKDKIEIVHFIGGG